jgi:hypothetical protein
MQHPITPPDELVQQWRIQAPVARDGGATREQWIATQAARWGADQELEACCAWQALVGGAEALRAARRPKPPSLKEQALAALDRQLTLADRGCLQPEAMADADTIRRALEALDDE